MAEAPENTVEKRANVPPVEHRFKPGNPGRPKGSRNKLGEAFLKAMADDFEQHGIAAVEAVRTEKPDQYLKVIASILPKEIDIGDNFATALKESRDASVAAFYRALAEDSELRH